MHPGCELIGFSFTCAFFIHPYAWIPPTTPEERAFLQDKGTAINEATSSADIQKITKDAMVLYARKFGECDGRGGDLTKAYDKLVATVGAGQAASCHAQCWFLHWGSTCGNTLLSFWKGRLMGNAKCGSNPVFEIIFAM